MFAARKKLASRTRLLSPRTATFLKVNPVTQQPPAGARGCLHVHLSRRGLRPRGPMMCQVMMAATCSRSLPPIYKRTKTKTNMSFRNMARAYR